MAPFVRTVLGDIPSADLGVTYAHEHLVIDGGPMVELSPDFLLADVDKAVEEVGSAIRLGLRSVIDAMPCDMGRNVIKLATISGRSQLHVVASTGLHLETLYAQDHWSQSLPVDELAERFIADVVDGIDANDDHASTAIRTQHRAGVIKVAGGGTLSPRDVRVFEAAAAAHRATGVPILTHCTDGTAALEQVRLLTGAGVPAAAVTLSHTDKVVDRAYHRAILATGAFVEYDQAFRWPSGGDNGTLTLARLDARGRLRRPAHARPRCRASGLLGRVWRPPGHGLPARRLQRDDGRGRHHRRGSSSDLRRQSGPRLRLQGAPLAKPPRLTTEA